MSTKTDDKARKRAQALRDNLRKRKEKQKADTIQPTKTQDKETK